MKIKASTDTRITWLVIGLTIIVLLYPLLIREVLADGTFHDTVSYYNLEKAKEILRNGVPGPDKISGLEREYIFNPYHYFLAGIVFIAGDSLGLRVALIVLAVILAVTLNYILREHFSIRTRLFIFAILLSSPVFLHAFSTLNRYSLLMPLLAVSITLYLSNNQRLQIASLPLFFLVGLFGFFHAIIAIAIVLVTGKGKWIIAQVFAIALIISSQFVLYIELMQSTGIVSSLIQNPLPTFFSTLFGMQGLSLFSILLAILGIIYSWNKRTKLLLYYGLLVFLILSIWIADAAYINYLLIIVAVMGGYGLSRIYSRDWALLTIKHFSIFIVYLGLFFSFIAYLKFCAISPPFVGVFDGLEFAENTYDRQPIMLSSYSNGRLISYAGMLPVIDDDFRLIPDYQQRLEDSKRIFSGAQLDEITNLLSKYNVSHIAITSDMIVEGTVGDDEQGLLFMLTNNETFKYIYNDTSIQIWILKDDEGV